MTPQQQSDSLQSPNSRSRSCSLLPNGHELTTQKLRCAPNERLKAKKIPSADRAWFNTLIVMKEKYIAAKERWARKMAGQERSTVRSEGRLPPGQRQVHNFPVLDLGIRPDIPLEKWSLRIHGHVEQPVTLDWHQFMALPQFKDTSDFHCVTTWSQFDMQWEGVAFF